MKDGCSIPRSKPGTILPKHLSLIYSNAYSEGSKWARRTDRCGGAINSWVSPTAWWSHFRCTVYHLKYQEFSVLFSHSTLLACHKIWKIRKEFPVPHLYSAWWDETIHWSSLPVIHEQLNHQTCELSPEILEWLRRARHIFEIISQCNMKTWHHRMRCTSPITQRSVTEPRN